MTLTGLNRAFVKQGLKIARSRTNIGYAALCDTAELDEAINCYIENHDPWFRAKDIATLFRTETQDRH